MDAQMGSDGLHLVPCGKKPSPDLLGDALALCYLPDAILAALSVCRMTASIAFLEFETHGSFLPVVLAKHCPMTNLSVTRSFIAVHARLAWPEKHSSRGMLLAMSPLVARFAIPSLLETPRFLAYPVDHDVAYFTASYFWRL
jgi:hypothetical protein